MSDIAAHFTTEFSANFIHRVQQGTARLDAFVEDENFDGERKRYDRLFKQESREKIQRIQPTTPVEVDSDSRWCFRRAFDIPNILDEDDAKNLGKLVLPTSEYVKSHAMAYYRDCDKIAWQAALDDVYTGELGTTASALPAGQKILHGSTGLTLDKLLTANEILEGADLEDDAQRVIVVSPKQMTNLLNTTEIKSADYNSVKALVSGQVDTFMGFKFIKSNFLRKVSTTRTCVCFVKGAIKRVKGSMSSKISTRDDLSEAIQIRSKWHLSATRVYDEGVVSIECTES
jgi:hypothetical protein